MKSDFDIAREAPIRPIAEVAGRIGLTDDDLIPYGKYIAKIPLGLLNREQDTPDGKLILVTAMTPTPMGEGKTTNTIGLGQALTATGRKAVLAIREPSLGPCMGVKGGAAGGGYSQVLPMEDINLHFTGDMHAVTSAHNLLSAMIDNHLHQKLEPELHSRKVAWRRVMDMNDRSLRNTLVGLGGEGINGVMREDGFEITAASEIMAILCLANSLPDLKERISRIIVGYDSLNAPVTAGMMGAAGAMTALLKHAMNPNLVQSLEGTPVLVHGGPFANIAHGCNTMAATKIALKLGDYVVTEAGFGADLGAEKFFDIKCRYGGLMPSASVLVVTRRAWDMHGIENVTKHVENLSRFNIPCVISLNKFLDDSMETMKHLQKQCEDHGMEAVITDFREQGGAGGLEMAERIVEKCSGASGFTPLYPLEDSLETKIETIACRIYGAKNVSYTAEAAARLKRLSDLGFGSLPVCMAKTQSSLSDNPKLPGRPEGFTLTVQSAKVSAGAGFVVVYTGKIMTMPGLPKSPSALNIDVDAEGRISGLF